MRKHPAWPNARYPKNLPRVTSRRQSRLGVRTTGGSDRAFKPLACFRRLMVRRVGNRRFGAEGNRQSLFSTLTRARPRGTIFGRIHRTLVSRSNPYLLEKYASCHTPNADRHAGCAGSGRLLVPYRAEAGLRGASRNRAATDGKSACCHPGAAPVSPITDR